ncbi:hypothetical protein PPYR_11940 [Photinus pyralis]|uniref:Potassium channel domain-containing protein n=1 Tax=Photinus pyralis TaxID=7054 RepID=A0A5N4ACR7_PHOPY|nr:TWiK family of potassium channels protein 18-like isoform X2 [Photinus pyralis]KAB0795101.1 hypothetical protein PPYR_11940 [Photinus pyralis]
MDTPPVKVAPKTPIDRGKRPPRLILPNNNNYQQQRVITPSSPYPASITSKVSSRYAQRAQSKQLGLLKGIAKSGLSIGEKATFWIYNKLSVLSKRWFTHWFLTIVLALYTVGGALIFIAIEGTDEDVVVEDVRKARFDLIWELRNYSNTIPRLKSEGEWEGAASKRIEEYEAFIIQAYKNKSLIIMNDGPKLWSFFNAVVYCGTIYTTIGYGHMFPTTNTGMALTIVYAIIGIPLFLIALTDFGKLFTRGIKFVWSFVRRLYYTGSCRKVRKTAHVQDLLQGAQMVYDIARLRKPSMFVSAQDAENPKSPGTEHSATPTTPALSHFEIDDEFNLPISVAIFILVLYIFLGAVMYCIWEKWDFFGSFYFVFISLSTIGFGDYVPNDPFCMMASVIYLVFGLALMSMCINVVQVKLSDTFSDASAKLGATIGLNVNEEDGSIDTVTPAPIEIPDVHQDTSKSEDREVAVSRKSGKRDKSSKTNDSENNAAENEVTS